MHQQVQFFIDSLWGQHIGIGCLVAGILEPGGLDMAFFYQLGQAVMRLSQAEPQIKPASSYLPHQLETSRNKM
jgi:hypothetical protein